MRVCRREGEACLCLRTCVKLMVHVRDAHLATAYSAYVVCTAAGYVWVR
jgi:hypothetical protein